MQKGNIRVQTENIFPIIKKFLYSDHEIFLRELISNAVDASPGAGGGLDHPFDGVHVGQHGQVGGDDSAHAVGGQQGDGHGQPRHEQGQHAKRLQALHEGAEDEHDEKRYGDDEVGGLIS